MLNKFKELTRAYSLPVSITPFLIALCAAYSAAGFYDNGILFGANALLILIAIVLLHLGGNLFDDYRDVLSELKKGKNLSDINFRNKEKAKLILNKTYSLKSIAKILAVMFSIAVLIGLYFTYLKGETVFYFMVISAILCLFYPKSAKYGLSEIVITLLFGPLLINGAYYALTGTFDVQIILFSIASGLLTSILLIAHSLMDYEYDITTDKKTIPVLIKNKPETINFIGVIILISYILIIYTTIKYETAKLFLAPVILTLPVSYKLIKSLYDYINIKDVQFIPKWYLGVMENWEEIKKNNMAYFMYRFYLARNLASIFNIILALVCLLCFTPDIFREYRLEIIHTVNFF